jgi:hypothetical protein
MSQGELTVVACDDAQLARPIRVGGINLELNEDGLGDAVEQSGLVGCVPIKDHRVAIEGSGETAHGQALDPLAVDEVERGGQYHLSGDLVGCGCVIDWG